MKTCCICASISLKLAIMLLEYEADSLAYVHSKIRLWPNDLLCTAHDWWSFEMGGIRSVTFGQKWSNFRKMTVLECGSVWQACEHIRVWNLLGCGSTFPCSFHIRHYMKCQMWNEHGNVPILYAGYSYIEWSHDLMPRICGLKQWCGEHFIHMNGMQHCRKMLVVQAILNLSEVIPN